MKPILLKMRGFITYREEEVIDFTQFQEQKLFIITGPTGAGKTSIFDAICYALYGSVSTQQRESSDDGELRCHYLNEKDPSTYVEFTFEVGNKRYLIHREPKQLIIKRSKKPIQYPREGFLVEFKDGKEVFLTESISEMNAKIEELLGLKKDQFNKIVLLPQGEFAEFLSSKSETKKEILGKIFGTAIYARMEQELRNQYIELRSAIGSIQSRIDSLISQLDEGNKMNLQDILVDEKLEIHLYGQFIEKLDQLLQEDQLILHTVRQEREDLDGNCQLAKDELKQIQGDNQKILIYQERQRSYDEQKGKEGEYRRLKKKLELGKGTEALHQQELFLTDRQTEWKNLHLDLQKARQDQADKKREWDDSNAKLGLLPKKKEHLETLRNRQLELKHELEVLARLDQYHKALRSLYQDKQECIGNLEKLETSIKADRAKLDIWLDEIQHKDACQQEKAAAILENHRLESGQRELSLLLRVLNQLRDKEGKLEESKTTVEELSSAIESHKINGQILEEKIQNHQLWQFAKHLEEGQPCPLCGSKHHPQPIKQQPMAEEKELDLIKRQLEDCRLAYEQARRDMAVLEAEMGAAGGEVLNHQEALANLGFHLELGSSLHQNINSAQVLDNQIRQTKTSLDSYRQNLDKRIMDLLEIEENRKPLEKQLETKQIQYHNLDLSRASIQARIKNSQLETQTLTEQRKTSEDAWQIQNKLKDVIRHCSVIETEMDQIQEQHSKIQAQLEGIDSRRKLLEQNFILLTEKRDLQEMEFNLEVRNQFGSKDNYQALRNEYEHLAQREQEIDDFFSGLQTMGGEIRAITRELSGKEWREETPYRQNVQRMEDELAELDKRILSLHSKLENNLKIHKSLGQNRQNMEPLLKRHQRLAKLESLARGNEGLEGREKINFETFVLLYYFDSVLAYANRRLYKMTGGQYEMVRKEDIQSTRGKQGLDINVIDANTGKERSAATLSGGESFLASLALALGVSDEMMNNSGAVALDTLFIDEGFGSLDPDALESAINCLQDLTQNNRLIGIISHVEDLKEKIPNKIVVQYYRDIGSKLNTETL